MPYGPYASPPTSNPANSGFAPASSIATGMPMFDMAVNLAISSMNGGKPMLGTFKRPSVSDYQYTSMQERNRVFELAKPSLLAANPFLKDFGKLGENKLFQEFADQYTPGGSMTDAFGVVMGNFTENMAGPGIRNAEANAVMSANIVRNVSNSLTDKDGNFDYMKTSGFNRAEVFQNMAAINRKFGGYMGKIPDTSQEGSDRALSNLATDVFKRPSMPYGPTPDRVEQISKTKDEVIQAQNILENRGGSRNIDITEPTKLVQSVINRASTDGKLTDQDKEEISGYGEAINAINTLNQDNIENESNVSNTNNTENKTNTTNKTTEVDEVIKRLETKIDPESGEPTKINPVSVQDGPRLGNTIDQFDKIIKKFGTEEEIQKFNKQKNITKSESENVVDITEPSKLVKNIIDRKNRSGELTQENIQKISSSSNALNAINEVPYGPRVERGAQEAETAVSQFEEVINKFGTDEERQEYIKQTENINRQKNINKASGNENNNIDITDPTKLTRKIIDRANETGQMTRQDANKISSSQEANSAILDLIDSEQEYKELEKNNRVKRIDGESTTKTISELEDIANEIGTEEDKNTFKSQKEDINNQRNSFSSKSDASNSIDITTPTELVKTVIERASQEGKISEDDKKEISTYTEALDAIKSTKEVDSQEDNKNIPSGQTEENKNTVKVDSQEQLKTTLGQFSKIVEKFGTDTENNQLNTQIDQITENTEKTVSDARETIINGVQQFGTEKDIQQLNNIINPKESSNPLAVLSEPRTAVNAKAQDKASAGIMEQMSMVREAQNLFGKDVGVDKLMDEVGKLIEGSSGMSAGRVRDLLQKIQATAVVVDMSNEAIVRYFEVTNQMYKGMGVRGGNQTDMAQNALIAAKGITDARKQRAQERGEMYTGEGTEELAIKVAEYQGRVARSGENQDLAATLATLDTSGTEGQIAMQIKQAMDEGDFAKARKIKEQAIESGAISSDKATQIDLRSQAYEEQGGVSETDYKIIKNKFGEGDYYKNLTGENVEFVQKQIFGSIADKLMGTENDSFFADTVTSEIGDSGTAKLRAAIEAGEITQEEAQDQEKLTNKIMQVTGASRSQAGNIAGAMGSAMTVAQTEDDFNVAGDKEALQNIADMNARQAEIQEEIALVSKERGPMMRDLNIGEQAAGTMSKIYKDLKKQGNSEVTFEQVVRAAGGALGDYDQMTEEQKNLGQGQLDLVTGNGGILQEKYEQAQQDAKTEAQAQVDKLKKTTNIDEKTEKRLLAEYESKIFEEKKSKIAEEIDGSGVKLSGETSEKEGKQDFDPKDAIERILKALEGIADKLGVKQDPTGKSGTGGANIRTENSGYLQKLESLWGG